MGSACTLLSSNALSGWLPHCNRRNDGLAWVGHEKIRLTIDVYGHLILDAKKDAAL